MKRKRRPDEEAAWQAVRRQVLAAGGQLAPREPSTAEAYIWENHGWADIEFIRLSIAGRDIDTILMWGWANGHMDAKNLPHISWYTEAHSVEGPRELWRLSGYDTVEGTPLDLFRLILGR